MGSSNATARTGWPCSAYNSSIVDRVFSRVILVVFRMIFDMSSWNFLAFSSCRIRLLSVSIASISDYEQGYYRSGISHKSRFRGHEASGRHTVRCDRPGVRSSIGPIPHGNALEHKRIP